MPQDRDKGPQQPARRFAVVGLDALAMIPEIGPTAMCVLLILIKHADQHGRCWPSVELIGKSTGIKRRAVQLALGVLRNSGLIRSEPRYGAGQSSNRYIIHDKALPLGGRNKLRTGGATECAGGAQINAPKLHPVELDPVELEHLDHVFVSCDSWEENFSALLESLPKGTDRSELAFVGQLAWLLAAGAGIWPQVRDAITAVKTTRNPVPNPAGYIRKMLMGTLGAETLKAYLRRAPTLKEVSAQLPLRKTA